MAEQSNRQKTLRPIVGDSAQNCDEKTGMNNKNYETGDEESGTEIDAEKDERGDSNAECENENDAKEKVTNILVFYI